MGQSNSISGDNDFNNYDQAIKQFSPEQTPYGLNLFGAQLLKHNTLENVYAVSKSTVSQNENQYIFLQNNLNIRADMRHKHICQTIAYNSNSDQNFCSSSFQNKMLMEYSLYTLMDEVEKRKKQQLYFSDRELYIIVCEILSALCYFNQFQIDHHNIRLDQIFMCKQQQEMDQYNINQDSTINNDTDYFVKLQDPILLYPETNHQIVQMNLPHEHTYVYLSPILTHALGQKEAAPLHNVKKSDLFTLGMNMLHISLLEDNYDCYDYEEGFFLETVLHEKIKKLRERYCLQYTDIIESMLIKDEQYRPNPQDFYEIIRQNDNFFMSQSPTRNRQQVLPTPAIVEHQQEEELKRHASHKSYQHVSPQQQPVQYEEEQEIVKRYSPPKHQFNTGTFNQEPQQQQFLASVQGRVPQNMQPDVQDDGSYNNFRPVQYYNKSVPDETGDHELPDPNQTMKNSNISSARAPNSDYYAEYNNSTFKKSAQVSPAKSTKTYEINGVKYDVTNDPLTNQKPQVYENKEEYPKHSSNIQGITNKYTTSYQPQEQPQQQQYKPFSFNQTTVSTQNNIQQQQQYEPYKTSNLVSTTTTAAFNNNTISNVNNNVNKYEPYRTSAVVEEEQVKRSASPMQKSGVIDGGVIKMDDPRNPYYNNYNNLKKSQTQAKSILKNSGYSQANSNVNIQEEGLKRSGLRKSNLNADAQAISVEPYNPVQYNVQQQQQIQQTSNISAEGGRISLNDPRNPHYQKNQEILQRNSQIAASNNEVRYSYQPYQPSADVQQGKTNEVTIRNTGSYTPNTNNNIVVNTNNANSYQSYNSQAQVELQKSFITRNLNVPSQSQLKQTEIKKQVQDKNLIKSNLIDPVSNIVNANGSTRQSGLAGAQASIGDFTTVNETYQDNSKYEGQMRNGQREGYGKFYYPMGGMYEGQWKEDKMHGRGKLFGPSGFLTYDGEFQHDKFEGIGIVYNEDVTKDSMEPNFKDLNNENRWTHFDGLFRQDNKDGWGTLYFYGGEKYQGQFSNDMANGKGTYINKQGEIIYGNWVNNVYYPEQ